jgi:GAF domain-containing protein
MTFQELQPKVTAITLNNSLSRDEKLLSVSTFKDNIDYYNWVGFYFANQESKTLHLGPYVGAETDHTVIPFGKGFADRLRFQMKILLSLM